MNKKQQTEIVDIVSKYLPRCYKSATCHCYGNIPQLIELAYEELDN